MRIAKLCILASALLASASWSASYFPDDWDDDFKDAAGLYLPGVDWRLLKAQCYQESLLNPLAVSPAGARGLCQFMPLTWTEVSNALPEVEWGAVFVPEASIIAAAYYMRRMRNFWTAPRPEADRHLLAMASYNAGAGNILRAQRACTVEGMAPSLYKDIIMCLPLVTGEHSKETTTYVRRIITNWYPPMLLE